MKFNQYSPDFAEKTIRLLEVEVANPLLVFQEVFEFYDLNHIRMQISDWLELAFSSEDDDLKDSIPRINLMQFALHMEAMAEAAFLLHQAAGPPKPSGVSTGDIGTDGSPPAGSIIKPLPPVA